MYKEQSRASTERSDTTRLQKRSDTGLIVDERYRPTTERYRPITGEVLIPAHNRMNGVGLIVDEAMSPHYRQIPAFYRRSSNTGLILEGAIPGV